MLAGKLQYLGEYRYTWIAADDIIGTDRELMGEFDQFRLTRALNWLLEGQYQIAHECPPDYINIHGDLYVARNGNHRSMAFKIADVDRVQVTVRPCYIEAAGYCYWCQYRDAGLLPGISDVPWESENERVTRIKHAKRRRLKEGRAYAGTLPPQERLRRWLKNAWTTLDPDDQEKQDELENTENHPLYWVKR